MNANEYQQKAMRTMNKELSGKAILVNAALGLCGEAGEAADIIKKHIFHDHELDRDGLIKELGDVAWYIAEAATVLGVSLEEVLSKNIEKLQKRYPEGFDYQRSIKREE